MKSATEKALNEASRDVAAMVYAKAKELAAERLNSRRDMFVEGLTLYPVNDDVWIVELDAKVRWIDDGVPEHSMLDDLLKSPKAKTAKDGSKYVVVPFNHGPGKGPTNSTQAQQDLTSTIKTEMKRRKIPFGKIEKGEDGSPKIGKLHSFDIMNAPNKTHEGPGQGKGPVGSARQGPTGIPFLQGVNVYQSKVKDKAGKESVKKSIMTFRVASSKHKSEGRWEHPGLDPVNILDDAMAEAMEEFEKEIAPGLIGRIYASMD
jgi:hypothetical protein